jgi:hypothetical protein
MIIKTTVMFKSSMTVVFKLVGEKLANETTWNIASIPAWVGNTNIIHSHNRIEHRE